MQDVPDATLVLKGKLASVGGLKAFRAKAGHSPGFALHALELAMSKVSLASFGAATVLHPISTGDDDILLVTHPEQKGWGKFFG